MLSTPSAGWADITIGSFSDRCSYIEDIPNLLLDAFITRARKRVPVAIEIDAEGYEYTIVLGTDVIHIISEIENDGSIIYKLTTPNVDFSDLAREMISDLRLDIDAGANWDMSGNKKAICEAKEAILAKCKKLEMELIPILSGLPINEQP